MTTQEIRYDHDAMEEIAAQLDQEADNLIHDVQARAARFLDTLTREASQFTVDGQPAPIYRDVLAGAEKAMEALTAKVTAMAGTMRADAVALREASAGAEAVGQEAAAGIDRSGDPYFIEGTGWVADK